ncbi:CBN-NEP-1 protein, partial [Aphelenchoides avenae]
EYDLETTGVERLPRWKVCTNEVVSMLPQAAGALYVRRYFPPASQAPVAEMVDNIRGAFRQMIAESDWMDPRTKQYALEKADAMTFTVGFGRMHFDDRELDQYHEGINLSPRDSYSTMVSKIAQYTMQKSFRSLLVPVDRTEFFPAPTEANGYYMPTRNGF